MIKITTKRIKTEGINVNDLPDIYKVLKQYGADEVEVCEKSDLDHYYKMCTTLDDVERFNYQDDYWGDGDRYQEDNVWLFERIEKYIGKEVYIFDEEYFEEACTGTVLGIAIDKQYNSMAHTYVVVDEFATADNLNESKPVEVDDDFSYKAWRDEGRRRMDDYYRDTNPYIDEIYTEDPYTEEILDFLSDNKQAEEDAKKYFRVDNLEEVDMKDFKMWLLDHPKLWNGLQQHLIDLHPDEMEERREMARYYNGEE